MVAALNPRRQSPMSPLERLLSLAALLAATVVADARKFLSLFEFCEKEELTRSVSVDCFRSYGHCHNAVWCYKETKTAGVATASEWSFGRNDTRSRLLRLQLFAAATSDVAWSSPCRAAWTIWPTVTSTAPAAATIVTFAIPRPLLNNSRRRTLPFSFYLRSFFFAQISTASATFFYA